MDLKTIQRPKRNEPFKCFREFFNDHLKIHPNYELAFVVAKEEFNVKYGFYPYGNCEDYIPELFK